MLGSRSSDEAYSDTHCRPCSRSSNSHFLARQEVGIDFRVPGQLQREKIVDRAECYTNADSSVSTNGILGFRGRPTVVRFFVEDDSGSNVALSYVYDLLTGKMADLGNILIARDKILMALYTRFLSAGRRNHNKPNFRNIPGCDLGRVFGGQECPPHTDIAESGTLFMASSIHG